MKLFSLDSPFHKYGTIVFDVFVLTFLWLFTSILSFGFLAPLATAGFMNSINATMIDESGYMLKSFIEVFRKRFLRNILVSITITLLFAATIFNIQAVSTGLLKANFLLPIYFAFLFELSIVSFYALALMTQTDMTYFNLFKLGFILSNKHIFMSFIVLLSFMLVIYLTVFVNPFILVITTGIMHVIITFVIFKKVFTKYYLDKLAPNKKS